MDTFDVVVIIGGACGLFMVVGGMILLYKGAITLNQASPEAAVALEFKKTLRITTHYPALGLFIIGLAFIITSAWYSNPGEISPIRLAGQVENLDPRDAVRISIYGGPWLVPPLTDGSIRHIITPNLEILKVEISAPGIDPIIKAVEKKDIRFGTLSLGKIQYKNRRVVDAVPTGDPALIETPSETLPPLEAAGSF